VSDEAPYHEETLRTLRETAHLITPKPEEPTREPPPSTNDEQVEFVATPVTDFASVEEPDTEALVTAPDGATVIPVNGLVLVYGKEGASKTTLVIDWLVHFAQGRPWHGLLCPGRPLRILLLENEGPRPEFRRKLARRLAVLPDGIDLGAFIHVLEEPWAKVNLRYEDHRKQLARLIAELSIDLLVIGPLFAMGMVGPGNADDINAFVALLDDVRERAALLVCVLVVHHENKAGDVSGAWGPRPDLLTLLQTQEPQHVRVHWRKAKWASLLHGQSTHLKWAEGETFEVTDVPAQATRGGGVGGHRRVRTHSRRYVLGTGGEGHA
jgi:hypothetical protein